ncbi:MAG: hypothetical protein QW394_09755, partial [Thermofilaceae archaeon]
PRTRRSTPPSFSRIGAKSLSTDPAIKKLAVSTNKHYSRRHQPYHARREWNDATVQEKAESSLESYAQPCKDGDLPEFKSADLWPNKAPEKNVYTNA